MKTVYAFAALAILSAASANAQPASEAAPVAAAHVPSVARGAVIFSADGRRIGRVDRVRAASVSVIYHGKFVEIPTDSLSSGERGLTTSLTQAELAKL